METCFICRKQKGQESAPPGGYIYEDKYWMVCHAPIEKGPLGTLLIESKRHFLDFAEMTPEEAASFGTLSKKIYSALKSLLGPERIYQVSMMEGIPHFHTWIVPRTKDITEHGVAFLAKDLTCIEEDAVKLAMAMHKALKSGSEL